MNTISNNNNQHFDLTEIVLNQSDVIDNDIYIENNTDIEDFICACTLYLMITIIVGFFIYYLINKYN